MDLLRTYFLADRDEIIYVRPFNPFALLLVLIPIFFLWRRGKSAGYLACFTLFFFYAWAVFAYVVCPLPIRASHIKPWADCATDAERLDVWNGLLLAPHLDAAFDAGFLTVSDDGEILFSPLLPPESRAQLGLYPPLRVRDLAAGHRAYLPWHREKVFRRGPDRH